MTDRTDPAPGTLADVREARRALLAVFEPRWLRVLVCLVGPVVLAAVAAPNLAVAVTALAMLLAGQVALLRWQYTRPVRPQPVRLWANRVYAMWLGLVVGFVVLLGVVRAVLPYPQAAAVMFVVGVLLLTAGYTVAWNSDPLGTHGLRLAGLPDDPPGLDPAIAPRYPLQVCAILATVDQVDAALLSRMLRLSVDGLDLQTAELVAAQYLNVEQGGRQHWFGLTPIGRSAYGRHLRALQSAGAR